MSSRERPTGGTAGVWMAQRSSADEPFQSVEAVTADSYRQPSITADGLTLFVVQDGGVWDLAAMTRDSIDDPWSRPRSLGDSVNSPIAELYPSISGDGRDLYFTRAEVPLVRSDRWEIWIASREDATDVRGFAPPAKLPETINDGNNNATPAVSPDGLTLIFSSDRPGGFGGLDLWAATRASRTDSWDPPVNLGPEINTALPEWAPFVTFDGAVVLFTRTDALDPNDVTEDANIWQAPFLTTAAGEIHLRAGDADRDLDFDQLDLVQVQAAGKYLTGQSATWGEGDWNGAPGGSLDNPPVGDGQFNQFDIVAAQQAATYLAGPYAGFKMDTHALVAIPEPGTILLAILAFVGLLPLVWRPMG